MEKSLSFELLTEITDFNKNIYEKKWNEYQEKNSNDNVLKQITEKTFLEQPSIKITDYSYYEYLTTHTSSGFYNTLSYIKTLCDTQIFDSAKIELTKLNSHFQNILNNAFDILENTQNNVEIDEAFESFLIKLQIELYQNFWMNLKKELGTSIIPCFLKTYLNMTTFSAELDLKKYQVKVDKSLKIINSKVQFKTQELLEKIYKAYALKEYLKQQKAFDKKNRFQDFSNDKALFSLEFDDQKVALETLGLSLGADWTDVKKAYKKLALKYHPDNNKLPNAEIEMRRINIAYNLLKKMEKENG